jgi:toxin secretion/phage lysis holin
MDAVITGTMIGLATVGGAIATLLGGADVLLDALLLFMCIDILLGVYTSVRRKSTKTPTGRFSSEALYKGLTKKFLIFVVIIIAVYLDRLVGTYIVIGDLQFTLLRSAVMLFYIFEETTSILENLAVLGVPLPYRLRCTLEVLKFTNDAYPWDENSRYPMAVMPMYKGDEPPQHRDYTDDGDEPSQKRCKRYPPNGKRFILCRQYIPRRRVVCRS